MRQRRNRGTTVPEVRVEYRDIGEVTPYEHNPRDNEAAVQSVARSIESFGFLVPLVVDAEGVIVAGHTRYTAAIQLGLTSVPTISAAHLTQEQIDAFRLIDNKVSELARWDFDLLAGEIGKLQNSGIDLTQFGWSQGELDCFSDVVAEDCLSAGAASSLENDERQRRVARRAPANTRFVLGEFVLFLPTEAYRRWANQVRIENDYDEAAIAEWVKDTLGITPYLERGH